MNIILIEKIMNQLTFNECLEFLNDISKLDTTSLSKSVYRWNTKGIMIELDYDRKKFFLVQIGIPPVILEIEKK